jgi:hypothetical protein
MFLRESSASGFRLFFFGSVSLAFVIVQAEKGIAGGADDLPDPSLERSCANIANLLGSPMGQSPYVCRMLQVVSLFEELREMNRRLPKVEIRYRRMVVYRDGLTVHKVFVNRTQEPLRVDLLAEAWYMRGASFKDSQGATWQIQWRFLSVQPGNVRLEDTAVVEPGESLDVLCVVHRFYDDEPMFGKIAGSEKPADGARPEKLTQEMCYPTSMYRKDLRARQLNIQRITKCSLFVEWKDENIPGEMKTHVVEDRPKDDGSRSHKDGEESAEPGGSAIGDAQVAAPCKVCQVRRRPMRSWRFLSRRRCG